MSASIPIRFTDWRSRLTAYLTAVVRHPLVYGQHDCALFVAGSVKAMTGFDAGAPYRGRYTSIEEGLALLALDTGPDAPADHIDVFRKLFQPVPTAFAQVGDIAVIVAPESNLPVLGIFEGQHIAVLADRGVGFVPREMAVEAFRVP